MKISEFIERLEELRGVAGEDLEVAMNLTIIHGEGCVSANAEICNVVPLESIGRKRWKCLDEGNTEQIVVVW